MSSTMTTEEFNIMKPIIREFLLLIGTDSEWAANMGIDYMKNNKIIHAIMHNKEAALKIWSDLIKENPDKMKFCESRYLNEAIREGFIESRIFGMEEGYFKFCKVLFLYIYH